MKKKQQKTILIQSFHPSVQIRGTDTQQEFEGSSKGLKLLQKLLLFFRKSTLFTYSLLHRIGFILKALLHSILALFLWLLAHDERCVRW
jgi:hypothetical protein